MTSSSSPRDRRVDLCELRAGTGLYRFIQMRARSYITDVMCYTLSIDYKYKARRNNDNDVAVIVVIIKTVVVERTTRYVAFLLYRRLVYYYNVSTAIIVRYVRTHGCACVLFSSSRCS